MSQVASNRYMLSFFEYFFYRVYDLYTRHGEKDVPVFYGIAVLTLFQMLSIIVIILIYILISGNLLSDINFELWVLGIVFVINYIYFMRNDRHRKIIKHYSQESKVQRKKRGIFILVYVIAVVIMLLYTVEQVRILNL